MFLFEVRHPCSKYGLKREDIVHWNRFEHMYTTTCTHCCWLIHISFAIIDIHEGQLQPAGGNRLNEARCVDKPALYNSVKIRVNVRTVNFETYLTFEQIHFVLFSGRIKNGGREKIYS